MYIWFFFLEKQIIGEIENSFMVAAKTIIWGIIYFGV